MYIASNMSPDNIGYINSWLASLVTEKQADYVEDSDTKMGISERDTVTVEHLLTTSQTR